MKKLKLLCGIALLALMAACGSGDQPKMIEPANTEFQSGELARYIELENEAAELTYAEVDGGIRSQFIRLSVPVTMVKDGFEDVDPRDIAFVRLLSVAVVKLIDANGSEVTTLSLQYDEMLKLKKLLTQKKGAKEVLVFEAEYHTDSAAGWFASTVKYAPTLTADIELR